MSSAFLEDERLAELLTQRAMEGLTASERVELDRLLAEHGRPDADVLDRTAASLLLASTLEPQPLPAQLRSRLDAAADAFIATELRSATSSVVGSLSVARKWSWAVAAAMAVIAIAGWWPRAQRPLDSPVARAPDAMDVPRIGPSLEEKRAKLAALPDSIEVRWTRTADPAAGTASGDVIWNSASQMGFMRFRGLPANDPSQEQYQLWIFDDSRPGCADVLGPDCRPVDGGVFDVVAGTEEIVVAIDAKLPVGRPALFAVTIERPGGVVVSARDRIVVLAPAAPG